MAGREERCSEALPSVQARGEGSTEVQAGVERGRPATQRLRSSLHLVGPWMRAGWRVKGTADASEPGTGHTREFKTGQKVVQFWDWLMLGNAWNGQDSCWTWGPSRKSQLKPLKYTDRPARGAQREEVWAHGTGVTHYISEAGRLRVTGDRQRRRRKWAHGGWSAAFWRDG